jgi:hypothetical protein
MVDATIDDSSPFPSSSRLLFRNPLSLADMASSNAKVPLEAVESGLPRTPSPIREFAGRTSGPLSTSRQAAQTQSASMERSFDHDGEKSSDHGGISALPILDGPTDSAPLGDEDPLKTFHMALGIPIPKPVSSKQKRNLLGRKKPSSPNTKEPRNPKISSKNQGVYSSVIWNERWTRLTYQSCDALLTFCMFIQIIVGAAVTALGAGNANNTIVTVFGAANTAVASLLAVLKSKGLPNRLRQDWNGWRELREYIEEREREIDMRIQGHGRGLPPLDIWRTVRDIEARYQTMRLTLEANRPDTYIRVPPALPR